jgi:hypothetical protein
MSHRRRRYSDSDSDVGRRVDSYSEDDYAGDLSKANEAPPKKHREKPRKEEKQKPEKLQPEPVKQEIVQPVQPPPQEKPKPQKLTKVRRAELIAKFKQGIQDPEYEVMQKENNTFRVAKRKTFYTPSASVEAVSTGGKTNEIPITWMNMQETMNQSLLKEVKHLRKKFEKISDKYEEKKSQPVVDTPVIERPVEKSVEKSIEQPVTKTIEKVNPKARTGQYFRAKRLNLLDF